MNKFYFIFLSLFMFSLVSGTLPNLQPEQTTTSTPAVNYSLQNVNNSQFLQGYTPSSLPIFNSTYASFAYNQTFSQPNTNVAYLNNTQTFTGVNNFNDDSIFNITTLIVNASSSRLQIGIPRGSSPFTNDNFRKNLSLWIVDKGNVSAESFRISKASTVVNTFYPLEGYCLDYEGGVAFGTCFRWEIQRTLSGSDGQMCLIGYQMEADGKLTKYGTGICFTKTATPGNNVFTTFGGPIQNLSASANAYVTPNSTNGGFEIIRQGPAVKAVSATRFNPINWNTTRTGASTKLVMDMNDAGIDGNTPTYDTRVAAILSKNGGQWFIGGDSNGTDDTMTVFGNLNATKNGNLSNSGSGLSRFNFTYIEGGSISELNRTAVPSDVMLLVRRQRAGTDTAAISIRGGSGSVSTSRLYLDTGDSEQNWIGHYEAQSSGAGIIGNGWEITEVGVPVLEFNTTTMNFGSTKFTKFGSSVNRFGGSSTCGNGVTCSIQLESGAFGVHEQGINYVVSSDGATATGTMSFTTISAFAQVTPLSMSGPNSVFAGNVTISNGASKFIGNGSGLSSVCLTNGTGCSSSASLAAGAVVAVNTSGLNSKIGGRLNQSVADTVNSATAETSLVQYNVASNVLSVTGDTLTGYFSGSLTGSPTATKQIRLYYSNGTTQSLVFDTGALSLGTNADYKLIYDVVRVSATEVEASISLNAGPTLGSYSSTSKFAVQNFSSLGFLNLTGTSAGVGAGTGMITHNSSKLNWEPGA